MDCPRWLPLESNPEVMTKFVNCLGMKPTWQFGDVYGLDPELLSMVPRPVCAVLLLFPVTEKYETFKQEEEEKLKGQPQEVSPGVYFIKQTIGNACGTIGLIHAVANNQAHLEFETDSALKKFLEQTSKMTPEERATFLEKDESIRVTHESSAQEGQTEAPSLDEKVNLKNLKGLHALILVNNKITVIHAKALSPLTKLQRLYLSKNMLKDMPANMPKSLQELRIHENEITKIKKASFQGMSHVIVMELGSNPLKSAGIDAGAFADLKRVSYIRIADTNITEIPKGLPSSLSELHLDGNKITKMTAANLQGLKNLAKLGLSYNEISSVENGTLGNVPHLRELHLDNNALTSVPPGLSDHKYIQVVYLHANKISAVGTGDFCPPGLNSKKAMYSGISLFSNPVPYWEVQPITFRCVFDRSAIQLGNYRKK